MTAEAMNRPALIRRGKLLEYATIGYNYTSLEALTAIAAGLLAGSVALVGFGFDSVIEVISGAALLWRLYATWTNIAASSSSSARCASSAGRSRSAPHTFSSMRESP